MDHVTHTERGHSNSEDHELINPATDTVSVVMKSIEKGLKKVPSLPSNCSIYRVPEPLRKIKPAAFRPRLVSIGPFYQDMKELQPMQVHKLRYLNNILERESRLKLCDYVKAIAEMEDRARECYSEIIPLKFEDFVEMMLLDGCFILELILNFTIRVSRHPNDPINNTPWMSYVIRSDLVLLENQLPFFVLLSLFNLLKKYDRVGSVAFTDHVHSYFKNCVKVPRTTTIKSSRLQFWRRKKKDDVVSRDNKGTEIGKDSEGNYKPKHLLDFIRLLLLPSSLGTPKNKVKMTDIRSAMELHEAGVKFEKGPTTSLLEITFSNGVLKIPTLKIQDITESLFRNLIAYEQCLPECSNEFTTYANFIDDLIDSPKDVELLQRKGIIVNWIGDPKEVSTLFNSLGKEVIVNCESYLSGVCSEVETYHEFLWHKWKANLMHNYFNTPWAFISVFAAVVLLILTGIQTICSIIEI